MLDVRCKRCGHRFPLPDDWSGRIPDCPNCRIQCEAAPFGEQEWLAETDPNPMLSCLHGKASDRQLRLFIANYCRRTWHLFQDERCRKAIEIAELHADGQVGDEELGQVYIEVSQIMTNIYCPAPEAAGLQVPDATERVSQPAYLVADSCRRALWPSGRITARAVGMAAENLVRVVTEGAGGESERGAWSEAKRAAFEAERRAGVDILREIFGNPFRPISLAPDWLRWNGGVVEQIARSAYEERSLPSGELDAARLGILADALEDAGCGDAAILGHLRSPGPHARGCWPLDLILGKS